MRLWRVFVGLSAYFVVTLSQSYGEGNNSFVHSHINNLLSSSMLIEDNVLLQKNAVNSILLEESCSASNCLPNRTLESIQMSSADSSSNSAIVGELKTVSSANLSSSISQLVSFTTSLGNVHSPNFLENSSDLLVESTEKEVDKLSSAVFSPTEHQSLRTEDNEESLKSSTIEHILLPILPPAFSEPDVITPSFTVKTSPIYDIQSSDIVDKTPYLTNEVTSSVLETAVSTSVLTKEANVQSLLLFVSSEKAHSLDTDESVYLDEYTSGRQRRTSDLIDEMAFAASEVNEATDGRLASSSRTYDEFVASPTNVLNEPQSSASASSKDEALVELPKAKVEFTSITIQSSAKPELRSDEKRGNPVIGNILTGIMQLLGGDSLLSQSQKPPARINNRGPPNFNKLWSQRPPFEGQNVPQEHLYPPIIPMMPPQHQHPMNHHNGHIPLFHQEQHPPQQFHIPQPVNQTGIYPTPSDVSKLLGIFDGKLDNVMTSSSPTVVVVVDNENNDEDETRLHSSPSSRNTVVIIHDGPVPKLDNTIESQPSDIRPTVTQETSMMTPSNWAPIGLGDTTKIAPPVIGEEPQIITHQPEPTIFDVTVVGSLDEPTKRIEFPLDASEEPSIITAPEEPETTFETTTEPSKSQPTETVTSSKSETLVTTTIVVPEPTSTTTSTISTATVTSSTTLTTTYTKTRPQEMGRPYVVPVDIEPVQPHIVGFRGPEKNVFTRKPSVNNESGLRHSKPTSKKPGYRPVNNSSLIRIDTCIVGDPTTCDTEMREWCRTENGISSCQCRPGYSRVIPRSQCISAISMAVGFKVDRLFDKRLYFKDEYNDPNSNQYQLLKFEAREALKSMFAKSSFSRLVLNIEVNRFENVSNKVMINATLQLEENDITRVPSVKRVVHHEIVNAITKGRSRIGASRLYVDGLLNSATSVEDINECNDSHLNDCATHATCDNIFGSFRCTCKPGYTDKTGDNRRAGRVCTACAADYCSNRGECLIIEGQRECVCRGKFIGVRCDIDSEVLGVAVGATAAALLIIALTLICLCVWNRRWKREQQKAEVMSVASMAGYLTKPPIAPPVDVEDRARWQHIADAMGSIYVQPEGPLGGSVYRFDECHYAPISRPRSRGPLYGPASLGPYEFDPHRDMCGPPPSRRGGTLRHHYL